MSSSEMMKDSESKLLLARSGLFDLGMTAIPRWEAQRRRIWAGATEFQKGSGMTRGTITFLVPGRNGVDGFMLQ